MSPSWDVLELYVVDVPHDFLAPLHSVRPLVLVGQDSLPVQRHGQLLSSTVELMKKLELPLSCLGFQ